MEGTKMRRFATPAVVIPGASALAAAAIVLTLANANSSTEAADVGVSLTAESYGSIEELAVNADAVVIATAGAIVGREVDDGGPDGGGGNPLVFREFAVREVLLGDADRVIVVAGFDLDRVIIDGQSRFEEGQSVVLFLHKQVSSGDAPGVSIVDEFWWPMNLDNGVFDIDGNTATLRWQRGLTDDAEVVVELDEAGEPIGVRQFTLSVIRESVATVAGSR